MCHSAHGLAPTSPPTLGGSSAAPQHCRLGCGTRVPLEPHSLASNVLVLLHCSPGPWSRCVALHCVSLNTGCSLRHAHLAFISFERGNWQSFRQSVCHVVIAGDVFDSHFATADHVVSNVEVANLNVLRLGGK